MWIWIWSCAHDRVTIMVIVLVIVVTTTFDEHNNEYHDHNDDNDDHNDNDGELNGMKTARQDTIFFKHTGPRDRRFFAISFRRSDRLVSSGSVFNIDLIVLKKSG
jgi:hypothetical protein